MQYIYYLLLHSGTQLQLARLNGSSVMLSNYNMTGHSMIFPPHVHACMQGSLYVRTRHNELRDLNPELLSAVCNDVEGEPDPKDISRHS